MSKLAELKKLNDEAKAMNEKRKALREELEATKEERKAARATQAQCRKDVREQKAKVRDLTAKVYEVFSTGDADQVEALADELMEASSALSATVRKFGEACKDPATESTDEEL